jgi:hypothetical protein
MEESINEKSFLSEDNIEDSGVMRGTLRRGIDHPMIRCLDGKSLLELLTQSWLKGAVLPKRSAS